VTSVAKTAISRYGIQYFVESDDYRGAYTAFDNVYRGIPFSNFQESMHRERYKLYDGTTEDLYVVFGPAR